MSAHSFISHRMFVAALSQNGSATAQNPRSVRGPDPEPARVSADPVRPASFRAQLRPDVPARLSLASVLAGGF